MNLTIVKIINACSCMPSFSHILPSSSYWKGQTIAFFTFEVDIWVDQSKKLYSIRRHKTKDSDDEFWIGAAKNFNEDKLKNHPYTTANCKVFNGYIMSINGQPVNDKLHHRVQLLSNDTAKVFNVLCLALGIVDD